MNFSDEWELRLGRLDFYAIIETKSRVEWKSKKGIKSGLVWSLTTLLAGDT